LIERHVGQQRAMALLRPSFANDPGVKDQDFADLWTCFKNHAEGRLDKDSAIALARFAL
jgi:hypothetical protein